MRYLSLSILAVLYILASVRYFPGHLDKTIVETLLNMLSVAPFIIGCTMLLVAFLQKVVKKKLSWDRVVRIFFMLSLLLELLVGIQDYVK